MINNFWENIEIYCGNHKIPIKFVYREGKDTFYACPHYMAKDKNHKNGHSEKEKQCYNRLAFADALGIVEKISNLIEDDILKNIYKDYTGYTYKYKFYTVTIFKYDKIDFKISLSVINNRIIS